MDGQVDGGVVKQDAGAIIRLSNLVFNVKSGYTRDYYGEKCFLKVGNIALFLVCTYMADIAGEICSVKVGCKYIALFMA